MVNRDKFSSISTNSLAYILSMVKDDDIRCRFCAYTRNECFRKSCFSGIETWLNTPCVKPEKQPTDNKAEKVLKELNEVL